MGEGVKGSVGGNIGRQGAGQVGVDNGHIGHKLSSMREIFAVPLLQHRKWCHFRSGAGGSGNGHKLSFHIGGKFDHAVMEIKEVDGQIRSAARG